MAIKMLAKHGESAVKAYGNEISSFSFKLAKRLEGPAQSPQGHEGNKHGELKSGSGKKVKSRKQAVAIALSEARQSGAKIPKKKSP